MVGWQISRKRSSVRQSFAAASALGSAIGGRQFAERLLRKLSGHCIAAK